jgi:hypothetical protein
VVIKHIQARAYIHNDWNHYIKRRDSSSKMLLRKSFGFNDVDDDDDDKK